MIRRLVNMLDRLAARKIGSPEYILQTISFVSALIVQPVRAFSVVQVVLGINSKINAESDSVPPVGFGTMEMPSR